jgi:hypothetical protein
MKRVRRRRRAANVEEKGQSPRLSRRKRQNQAMPEEPVNRRMNPTINRKTCRKEEHLVLVRKAFWRDERGKWKE